MINEIAEFKAYTEAPIYKRDNKNDNCFLGRFTREGIQDFEGFPRVLTIIARGYMFKYGSADIEYARRAISAWCSIPDKDITKEKEDGDSKLISERIITNFLSLYQKTVKVGFTDIFTML